MTTEQLLIKRYKVTVDYPQPPYNEETDEHKFIKGDLLVRCNVNGVPTFRRYGRLGHMSVGVPCIAHPEKYPDVFRKLEWYEDRAESDMPEYVRWNYPRIPEHGMIEKIQEINDEGIELSVKVNSQVNHINISYFLPATQSDYDTYKSLNPDK